MYNDRFKDAPWYEKSKAEIISVVGVGGIGSNTLYNLVKTVPATYYIYDDDTVNEYNVGTQFFTHNQIGKYKVEALESTLYNYTQIRPMCYKMKSAYTDIIISAVDSMTSRKKIFELWKQRNSRELLIDGRLRANLYEVYVVTPEKEEKYEATLFDDNEVDDGPCTFKQTAYFGMLIGARITQVVVNWLINKYAGENICSIPFKIYEVGEPFLIEVK